jgi:Suppressor of fused protein (SUFU)
LTWGEDIQGHYQKVWGVAAEACLFLHGPIGQLPADFSVLRFPPHGRRNMWTYATCCMSQHRDRHPLELHMFSRADSIKIVELLVVTAHFHRFAAKLDLGHTVNFGRPWLGSSACEYGLVSLPYLDGPSLENLSIGSESVKFYWLIPVSKAEVDFKKQYGLETLESKFDISDFDYSNPDRRSIL